MSHDPERRDGRERVPPDGSEPSPGTETVESYETEEGVVLYDAENPLAWLKADHGRRLGEAR